MYVKACIWNVDGVESKGRELRALVKKYEPDVLLLTELKTVYLAGMAEMGPGAKLDVIPSLRKGVRAAPRAGITILVRPGLTHCVRLVRTEEENRTNGALQTMPIELRGK